jgi:hypothetical protein
MSVFSNGFELERDAVIICAASRLSKKSIDDDSLQVIGQHIPHLADFPQLQTTVSTRSFIGATLLFLLTTYERKDSSELFMVLALNSCQFTFRRQHSSRSILPVYR